MNAKKAKALRKIARRETVGLPDRKYITDALGTITLGACTRKYYKELKKKVSAKSGK